MNCVWVMRPALLNHTLTSASLHSTFSYSLLLFSYSLSLLFALRTKTLHTTYQKYPNSALTCPASSFFWKMLMHYLLLLLSYSVILTKPPSESPHRTELLEILEASSVHSLIQLKKGCLIIWPAWLQKLLNQSC